MSAVRNLRVFRASLHALALIGLSTPPARAQGLPSEPISLAGGRLTISAEVSISYSTNPDTEGWFNYTDYEHNTLRTIRLGASTAIRATDRIWFLGEVRTENGDRLEPYAAFVRVRPWADRPVDIQAGRIPPTFGLFGRHAYANDNPLIGYPLAYQYLTSLRSDALPRTVDDLLRMRARGWRASYPVGSATPAAGLPLVSAFSWDTGVQIRVGSRPVEVTAALTTGTLSRPRVGEDNGGKQIAARLVYKPLVGLAVAASAARGAYLERDLEAAARRDIDDYTQRAVGVDMEYSRNYWLVRVESIASEWRLPQIGTPEVPDRLRALATSIEGRYKILPGVYAAARWDHLGFSRVTSPTRGTLTWDAPVTRLEVGGGYYLRRNLVAKLVYQHDRRDSARNRRLDLAAGQLHFWF